MLKSPRRVGGTRLWKALASPTRRRILDKLRDRPRTTGALAAAFPKLSRFAVMQHLDVLTEAKLVLVRREGRCRFNYLNAVPLAEMYERWVSRYAAPTAQASLDLKRFVENKSQRGDPTMVTADPTHSRVAKIETEIKLDAPIQVVFDALTVNLDDWWQFRVRADSKIVCEPQVGGRIFEDWGAGRGVLYGIITAWDPHAGFCSAGTNSWKAANFITWHRLESKSERQTVLKKSMQLFGDVSDELVTMMEQGNRTIMEKLLKEYVERGMAEFCEATMEYAYVIRPCRATFLADATEAERKLVSEHFAYLKQLTEAGIVAHAGRCVDATFGVVVFRVVDDAAAQRIMSDDPAVHAGVFTATLHPYMIALHGK